MDLYFHFLFMSSFRTKFTFTSCGVNSAQFNDAWDQGLTVETCCARKNKILSQSFFLSKLRSGKIKMIIWQDLFQSKTLGLMCQWLCRRSYCGILQEALSCEGHQATRCRRWLQPFSQGNILQPGSQPQRRWGWERQRSDCWETLFTAASGLKACERLCSERILCIKLLSSLIDTEIYFSVTYVSRWNLQFWKIAARNCVAICQDVQ